MPEQGRIHVGTAGWAVPRTLADRFPFEGSVLQRYAGRYGCVEINSTFYQSHRASTYARWATSTPAEFRFAAKLPRNVTHVARLVDCEIEVAAFTTEVGALGEKLGPLLAQLPPSLSFEAAVAHNFFAMLRRLAPDTAIAC